MPKREKERLDSSQAGCSAQCCRVVAVVSVDDRGQMVLPKEIREKVAIHGGDKLTVTTWEKDGEVVCISLTKIERLSEMVRGMLGPVAEEILRDQ